MTAARLSLAAGEWAHAERYARRAALGAIPKLAAEALELWAIAANHSGRYADCLQRARQQQHPLESVYFRALTALERLESHGNLPPDVIDGFRGEAASRGELLALLDAHLCKHAPHLAPTLPKHLWPDAQTLSTPRAVATFLRLPDLYPSCEARRLRLNGLVERVREMAELAEREPLPLTSVSVVPFRLAYQVEDHLPIQREWSRFVEAIVARNLAPADPVPQGEPIRVALVSAHLRDCTVHNYFSALYEAITERLPEAELIIVAMGARDAETERLAARAAHVLAQPNDHRAVAAATEFLRKLRPHVCLFPEVGMEPVVNALAAYRHAPVQMALWGHPASTALSTIDAFITADAAEPPNAEPHYTERLVRLPGLGMRPRNQPSPSIERNQQRDRPLTLVCAQSLFKWQPEFIDAVGAVLARVPRARMVAFLAVQSTTERAFLRTLDKSWTHYGVDPAQRLHLYAQSDRPTFLSRLAECDVALDTFMFSGGQTTLDTLSVGLAPITLPGGRMRGRQTAAALSLLGMEDAISTSPDDWVERVVARCSDPALRQFDRERIQSRLPEVLDDDAPVDTFVRWIDAVVRAVTVHGRIGGDAVDLARQTLAAGSP